MTKLRITVTKEILERSRFCGFASGQLPTSHCAIALAIRDIWPNACIEEEGIFVDATNKEGRFWRGIFDIKLPYEATTFIQEFDSATIIQRPLLPEISFEITIPEEIIDQINIDELKPLLENHPTLEFV